MSALEKSPIPVLVSDFDGTINDKDFFQLVVDELAPAGCLRHWRDFEAGQITHFEALRRMFAEITADEATTLAAVMRDCRPSPGFACALAELREAGWEVVVASAGCAWYIEKLLGPQLGELTLHANPGSFEPGRGLQMRMPEGSPFLSPTVGIDKPGIVRAALEKHATVAFAGDGRPDYPPAMLVPPEYRFARGYLADRLRTEGVPFRPFNRWSEVAAALISQRTAPLP